MASSTDRSKDSLPRPEVNPLMNPLLAGNMGRWAEVYFTSPPEKREEAVLQLLRELEAQNSDRQGSSPSEAAVRTESSAPGVERAMTERYQAELRRCATCGHDNPPKHQFCGMCGAQFHEPASPQAGPQPGTNGRYESRGRGIEETEPAPAESSPGHAQASESTERKENLPQETSPRDPYDLSLLQGLLENDDGADLEDEQPPSVRYRSYIGAVVAILILALGYLAWSGSRGTQSAQGSPPPPPPAAEPAPAAATPNTTSSALSNAAGPTRAQPDPAANKATQPNTTKPAGLSKQAESAQPTTAMTAASQVIAGGAERPNSLGNEGDELAIAQRYLNGTGGQTRDSTEAARWLWKSIGKHNGQAMLLLADLYLKGDGVSKNCDQARVLLDSAARRGMAGAGERIRNLQAFGCQ